jgi:voltage-gated potassium channel
MDKYDRKIAVAVTFIASFLLFGTVLYHVLEGWSYVDAFYFSGVTLTTVGYGDITPTHAISKILTVFFALGGVGIVLYSVSIIAQKYFEREEQRLHSIWQEREHHMGKLARRVDDFTRNAGMGNIASGVGKFAQQLSERRRKRQEFVPIESLHRFRARR